MKLYLSSDFTDIYDYVFDSRYDPEAQEFKRFTYSGMSRREMFQYFESLNFATPLHGLVRDIAPTALAHKFFTPELKSVSSGKLVVYTNERAHRGEGKILLSIEEAQEQFSNYYCSAYIPHRQTFRHLQIGNRAFSMIYRQMANNEWRSNFGDVKILYLGDVTPLKTDYPLFAIDYISEDNGAHCLLDFNIAPRICGTGVENKLTSQYIVELIKDHIEGRQTPHRKTVLDRYGNIMSI